MTLSISVTARMSFPYPADAIPNSKGLMKEKTETPAAGTLISM
ncbi:MAG: hypothetical protein QM664_14060 [Flavihumibacter sp.]